LAVKYTPDQKLIAVALLDRTIKVFFVNTLKHHLTLYGHALPALSISISLDSKLLLSTSADRTCKIWGLDFGDCHRSIRAHPESVMVGMFELVKMNEIGIISGAPEKMAGLNIGMEIRGKIFSH